MKIKLLGANIVVKDNYCALDRHAPQKIEQPYINMYVNITNFCNESCAFCCNPKRKSGKYVQDFDFFKFYYVLNQVIKSGLSINKVSFTGGEPTLDCALLKSCLLAVKEIDRNIFTVISTNGTFLGSLLDSVKHIDSIAVSRHHYLDDVNSRLFGGELCASSKELCDFPQKDKIHLSCNLIKGAIDSEKEIVSFLKFASSIGILDVGFVSLMRTNDYSRKHFVDFSRLSFDSIYNVFLSKTWKKESDCKCKNYLYLDGGNVVRVYMRHMINPRCSDSVLCFDGKNLRFGFNGNIIF